MSLLTPLVVPRFKESPPSYAPTEAEVAALYGTGRKKDYGETRGVFGDLVQLFKTLKQSPVVQESIRKTPELEVKLEGLREALEERITTKYHRLPERGWPCSRALMREAMASFDVYVATVCNPQLSRVSRESVEGSLAQIVGLDIQELKRGCDEGLLGRLLSLSIALSRDVNGSLDNFLLQQKKEFLERALVRFNSEDAYDAVNTSHAPNYLAELYNYLGIARRAGESQKVYETLSPNAKRMLGYFLEEYTYDAIFDRTRAFLEHTFWVATLDADTEEASAAMYAMLGDVGIAETTEELDRRYRVHGQRENPWQYPFIQNDLLRCLALYLIQKGHIVLADAKAGHRQFQVQGQALKCLAAAPAARVPAAAAAAPAARVPAARVPAAAAATPAAAAGNPPPVAVVVVVGG